MRTCGRGGVRRREAAPPLFHWLWALGLPVPPPLFLGAAALFLLLGGSFAALFGAAMALVAWVLPNWALANVAATVACTGAFYGFSVAALYRRKARRLGLGRWEAYRRPDAAARGAPTRSPRAAPARSDAGRTAP